MGTLGRGGLWWAGHRVQGGQRAMPTREGHMGQGRQESQPRDMEGREKGSWMGRERDRERQREAQKERNGERDRKRLTKERGRQKTQKTEPSVG